ncbi:MAG: heterodisulfide reductase-related iron-sulfur binding cluster [Myxococcaceae bacterium]
MPVVQSVLVAICVSVTLYFTLSALRRIVVMIRSGAPETLTHTWQDRARSVLVNVFGQKKVLEDKKYGFMHFWYLYGFLILGIGHMELVLFGLTRFLEVFGLQAFLYRNFLPESLIQLYEFSQDFMAFGVVLVVAIALYRRMTGKTKRLMPRSADAETILWMIGALYVSFFLFVGSETYLRMEAGELPHAWLWYLPISSLVGMLIHGPINPVAYWMHLGIFLGFAMYIPRSKHMHLLAAGPNIYFRHFGAVAKPAVIDFEKSEEFGVTKVSGLSWKAILDTFACTECGRCDAVCPANLTQKPLKPKKILHDLKMNIRGGEKIDLLNRVTAEYTTDSKIHLDELWACTTCAACVEVCPVLIDSVPTDLIQMRRNLVMMEAKDYPKELNSAFKGMEVQGNPWGVGQDKRADWTKELNVPLMADQGDREVEYLFWVGCAGATDDRAKKIQQALVRILKAANVDFAILGCDEKCSGDPARRMGNEYVYDTLAKENIETLRTKRFKKIFATCPHCFNQLKNEYQDLGGHYTVQHHTELINELLKDKRIPLDSKKQITETITFHDPCYLGRYNKQYDAPRESLVAIGAKTVEMSFSKQKSFCCGAGGGRMFMEETIGKRINHERTDQAMATGATTIATGCPFCMTMMSDGVNDKGVGEQIKVKDIAEIVAEQLA